MLTVNVHTLPLQEQWGESNPTVRRVGVTFPFFGGMGTRLSCTLYWNRAVKSAHTRTVLKKSC